MNDDSTGPTQGTGNEASQVDSGQRRALEESERKATEHQPENFKDRSTEEKVVEIGPDVTEAPIKGIDPDQRPGG